MYRLGTIILVTIAVLLLGGCTPHRYPHLLVTADSLAETHADSALLLLDEWQPQMVSAPASDRHYYHLVRLHAEDKAYIPHTSDSIVRTLIDYYGDSHDSPLLPRVYYLAGRVYQDMERMPEAIEYYHKSLELLDTLNDFNLLALTNCHIGTIYNYQELPQKAYPYFKSSYRYDSLAKDTTGMLFDLRDLGHVWRRMNQNNSALHYYYRSYHLAQQLYRDDMIRELEAQIAETYRRMGKMELAESFIRKSLTKVDRNDTLCIYAIATRIYMQKEQFDSVEYYAKTLINFNDSSAREMGYFHLAEVYQRRGLMKESIKYMKLFIACNEFITGRKNAEAVAKVTSLYNFNKQEKRLSDLHKRNLVVKFVAIVSLLCFTLLLVVLLFSLKLHKRVLLENRRNFIEYQRIQEDLRKHDTEYIQKKDEELRNMKDYFHVMNEHYLKEIEKLETELSLLKSEAAISESKQQQSKSIIAHSALFKTIKERLQTPDSSHTLSNEEWKGLEALTNQAYPSFASRLMTFCLNMDKQQFRVSMLVKLDFKVSEIAELTAHSMQSVNSTRVRLYKKIMGKEGRAADWDYFIKSL